MYKIYYSHLLHIFNDEIKTDILNYQKYIDPIGRLNHNTGGWQSNCSIQPFFKNWSKVLDRELFKNSARYRFGECSFEQDYYRHPFSYYFWYNINFKDDFNKFYWHKPTHEYDGHKKCEDSIKPMIAIYHVSIPDNFKNSIVLYDENKNSIYPEIEEGYFLFFEAGTYHSVSPNPLDEPRVSIVFEVFDVKEIMNV